MIIDIILWVLIILLLNLFLGMIVLSAVDKDERLLHWVRLAPYNFLNVLVIELWPLMLVLYFKEFRDKKV
jgi:hypothetical protein